MVITQELDLYQKLEILSDAAKYDVACTSSGVDRKGSGSGMGNCMAPGVCHTFSADGRCISLLKILFTNECIFDCHYCINRWSNDTVRTSFTPEEVCMLTMEFYRRNYIEGLFLSSGVLHTPRYTMEELYQTLYLLRRKYQFEGYIHVKVIPGAPQEMVTQIGFLADRVSINLELPTAESLKLLAPHKTRRRILEPMRQIQTLRHADQEVLAEERRAGGKRKIAAKSAALPAKKEEEKQSNCVEAMKQRNAGETRADKDADGTASGRRPYKKDHETESKAEDRQKREIKEVGKRNIAGCEQGDGENSGLVQTSGDFWQIRNQHLRTEGALRTIPRFVPAGQSTQMIIGATPESDFQIISVAESLYRKFDLKRVFYSAFVRVNDDSLLPDLPGGPPLGREHRLYQADWLLRFYGFEAGELLDEKHPNFNTLLDPKCDWALSHLEHFPVEVNRADYYTLLRVPGIGPKSARRIVQARRMGQLDFPDLKKAGVVLKRAVYFITCQGRQMYPLKLHEDFILRNLLSAQSGGRSGPAETITYRQLSLFEHGSEADCERPLYKASGGTLL